MATILYIADRSDTSVRLFDLANPSGSNNPAAVQTRLVGVDAGSYTPEMGLFAPDTGDGSFRTRRRSPSVDMTVQLRTTATSQDAHRQALNRLFGLLEIPRVLVYQGDGMAEAVHIYTLGSNIEQLLRGGQENWDLIVRQYQDVRLDLIIQRQPIILLATELSSDTNKLTNAMLMYDQSGTDGAVDGRPDSWTWRTTAGAADATPISAESTGDTNDGYGFTMAATSVRDLTQDYTNAAVVDPGDIWSGQFVFVAPAGVRCAVAIHFLAGGAPTGVETASAFVVGNGAEQRITIVSAAAPGGSDGVRIKLRVENTSGGALAVILRRAQVEKASAASRFRSGTETIPNDPALSRGRNYHFWNDGEASVPVKTVATMDTGATVQASLIGKRSQHGVIGLRRMGDLQETRYVQTEVNPDRGWATALYLDTANPGGAASADASGITANNYITVSHATNWYVSARRFRATRTTKLASLRGRFKVFARVRPRAQPRQFGLRLKWSPSLEDPATEENGEVYLDTYTTTGDDAGSAPTLASVWVEVDLGSIQLPLDPNVPLAGVALEVWTRAILPAGLLAGPALDIDMLWLVPADAAGNEDSIGIPFLSERGRERITGPDLLNGNLITAVAGDPAWTNGASPGNVRRLNEQTEASAWGPTGGTVLGEGRHRITFYCTDTLTGAHQVKFRVTKVSPGAPSSVVASVFNATSGKIPAQVTLEWDGIALEAYQPMVGIVIYGGGLAPEGTKGQLDISQVVYRFTSTVPETYKLATDPTDRYTAERLDPAGAHRASVGVVGELPFTADRGLNFLSIRHDEFPSPYYRDRQNKIARTPSFATSYRPGWFEL